MNKRVIKLIISCVFYALDWLLMLIIGSKHSDTCVVLYYHSVNKDQRSKFACQMDKIVRFAKPISADLKGAFEKRTHYVAVTFDDGFVSVIDNALPELTKRNISSTVFVPTGYLGKRPGWINKDDHDSHPEVVVNKDQLIDLKNNSLVSIGSHCVTHSNLLLLEEQEIKNELIESRRVLKEILEEDISLLSFPHGLFNSRIIELSYKAGYKTLFTIEPTMLNLPFKDSMIGRVEVKSTDWPIEFKLKLLGCYRWMVYASMLKRSFFTL